MSQANPAFTQVVAVSEPVRTIYVSGQNAVDTAGSIVGKGDIVAQIARPSQTWRQHSPP